MNGSFSEILSALQSELQEYGGLLHLFDRQQNCIIHHDPIGFLKINPEVEEQIEKVSERRISREQLVQRLAQAVGNEKEIPLSELMPTFPLALQPLLRALIEEINDLVHRTQRRTRQNRLLLAQCVEFTRQLVAISHPEVLRGTYSSNGELHALRSEENKTSAVA